jgi:CubicO group peptidase (beta-lactamase class C family)
MKPLIALLLIASTMVPSVAIAQTPALEFKELAEDTKLTTASGAAFTVSKGWFVARAGGIIVLEEPQRELAVALVEMNGPTIEEAIAQAWKRWKPDFARPVRMTTKPPTAASSGWDEVGQIVYETAAAERKLVAGLARRKGSTYYVTLVDGAIAALERRGAQMNAALNSLEVPGREEETFAGRTAHVLDAARAEKFLAFAEQARKQAKVPGVAIAIVQNGRVVVEKGLGVRELGKADPVTPGTLFMIGSMTKPLTSLLMARMVDRKKFSWDTPVTSLLPSFALGDAEVTKRVTLAHTVCACTGLPRWDMEFIFEWNKATPDSRIALLRGMKPTTGFGETFQYSNLMVAAGGYVAALAATGNKNLARGYVDAMNAEVLGPLDMKSTVLDIDAAKTREHAQPHARTLLFDAEPIPLETERGVDSVMPAGGAWSTVRDIARWMMLELGSGRLDGRQIVSEANILERRKPRAAMSANVAYGLALVVDDSRGLRKVSHSGGTFGFTSDATFFPQHDLGFVVLTNAAGSGAYTNALRRKLIELVFDANDEAEKQFGFGLSQLDEVMKKRMAETKLQADPAFVDPLVGTWTTAGLGEIRILRKGNAVIFDAGEWQSPVGEHIDQSGVRRLMLTGPPFAGLTLWPQTNNGKPGLLFETAQQKYWFERVN